MATAPVKKPEANAKPAEVKAETKPAPVASVYDGKDELAKPMIHALDSFVKEFKGLQSKLAAADGDRNAALKAWVETSDDAEATKLRNTIAQLRAQLNALAEKNVQSVTLSEADKEKIQTELNTRRDKIKSARKALLGMAESLSDDPEGVKAAIEKIGDPTRSTRGRKPGEEGSKLPRASVNSKVTGGNFEKPEEFDSFSKVALALNIEVKDLQLAFAHAAGVSHQDISKVDKPVTFKVKPHPEGAEYTIATTPKDRKKPGPRKASESAETKSAETAKSA